MSVQGGDGGLLGGGVVVRKERRCIRPVARGSHKEAFEVAVTAFTHFAEKREGESRT